MVHNHISYGQTCQVMVHNQTSYGQLWTMTCKVIVHNQTSYGRKNNLAYLLTYVNYWTINFNSSQILAYFPLSPLFFPLC